MAVDLEIKGPRTYDVKEAFDAVAATIDRFLEYDANRQRLKMAAVQPAQPPARASAGASRRSNKVAPAPESDGGNDAAAEAFDPKSLIGACVHDIRARAYRDHANIKLAHLFAKNGVTSETIAQFVTGEVAELLDLPTLEDLGPLVSLNIKSNLSMQISFNGKQWGEKAREQTDLKSKLDAYASAKQEQASGAASEFAEGEGEPEELASAREAADTARGTAGAVASAAGAIADPSIPTTIEEWEATADAALGEPDEEEEEAAAAQEPPPDEDEDARAEREVAEQLPNLLAAIGEELPKVQRHMARARFFHERLVRVFPYREERAPDEEFLNCAHAWDVLYELYSMLHHVDKARYYLASTIVFLQQSAKIAEGWLTEWDEGEFWRLDNVSEFFEHGSHLSCRKVCYGDKGRVAAQLSQAKAMGMVTPSLAERIRAPGGYTAMVDETSQVVTAIESPASAARHGALPGTGKGTPKRRLSDWRTKTLAFDDDQGKKSDKEATDLLSTAQSLIAAEFELNEAQQALYDLSQNELVQDALSARESGGKKDEAEAALKRRWKERLQEGLATDAESEFAPLLSTQERAAMAACDEALARAEVEASPMLDRFERFVSGMLDDSKVTIKAVADEGAAADAPASRVNNYAGAVAWSRGDDDAFFEGSDPGELRLARMLLHVYGNIENRPLAERAWTKFKSNTAKIDKQKLAINLAFYAVSLVITVTTGGAGLAVVLPARLALAAGKKATHYALDAKGKQRDEAKLSDSLKAARSKAPAAAGAAGQLALDVEPDAIAEFGEKVVAHFLSAQKNMTRLKDQRVKIKARHETYIDWFNTKAQIDSAQGDAKFPLRKQWRAKTLGFLQSEQSAIGDELFALRNDDALLRERQKETEGARESLCRRIEALQESIRHDPNCQFDFDAAEYLDVSPDFTSCDEAAAYTWGAVKFETHYQKFAHYSTYLLAYTQATLRELCEMEVYLRKRWGNAEHPGDIGKSLRTWITEQNCAKHVSDPSADSAGAAPRCATVVPTERTPLLRGKGSAGAKQAVRDAQRVVICYGPKDTDTSPEAWAPRYASSLENAQDTGEKTWKSVEETRAELAKKYDDLKKARDKAAANYAACKDALSTVRRVADLTSCRSLFS